jgi:fructokinase
VIRIGIDFGGTKIEAAALDDKGCVVARERRANPGEYDAAIQAVSELVVAMEAAVGAATVGMGVPGSISPASGRMRNANSTWLNGRPFREDLSSALGREIRLANDADCFALSEASDGAAAGAANVFGVIIGTGCGGGVVVGGALVESKNGIAGEWGHTPLPWPSHEELAHEPCWCGRRGCLETWISGAGFRRDHAHVTGQSLGGAEIVQAAAGGDAGAKASIDRYIDRLARGLAVVCDLLDPQVIVLGGGMSNVDALYDRLPAAIGGYVFSDVFETPIVRPRWGDSSGVRGAAWLWPSP